ncbi:Biopolymer transport protein ExbD/TolR [Polystyrenella longa]|uniref:Biopolymer transport protein ExbD/TolR n=1 Tax=Polystyrenella longa TaxID=2528007 RepID=A0A518CRZ3_9PLAN|nr:biopolymer transporter ExbD [Polystyrenella longa]QDU81983.1 Biopolymer transport protein ExbD/TolR [Polystyrenella longa]
MPIQFRCPQCKTRLSISRKQSGSDIKCPSCSAMVPVPAIDGATSRTPSQSPGKTSEDDDLIGNIDDIFGDDPSVPDSDPPPSKPNAGGPVIVGPPPEEDEDDEDEGFSVRSMETEMDDMDLTPMVDVTFLLLIFFMISASFSLQKTMPFPPPEPDEEGATTQQVEMEETEDTAILIEIDENNTIMIGDELEVIQDPAMVAEKIAQYARQQGSQEIMMTVNDQALHDTVVWVFDSAAEAGIQRVRITTLTE